MNPMQFAAVASVLITVIGVFCSIYYHSVFRPIAHDRARYKLFECRDDLRRLAITKEVATDSFAFQHLEGMLNAMVPMCDWYSTADVIEQMWRHSQVGKEASRQRFDAEASAPLKAIEDAAVSQMLQVMIANSPCWFLIARTIYAVRMAKATFQSVNRDIWHDVELTFARTCN